MSAAFPAPGPLARAPGRRLWLQGVSDRALRDLYLGAEALIYTPEDEGFGLPVLEARELGCPMIASDIAPLREAGGDWPTFIATEMPRALCRALRDNPLHDRRARGTPGGVRRDWPQVGVELLAALGELQAGCAVARGAC